MQEILIDAYFDDLLDDEEFVLFYDLNRTRNPPFPYWKYDPFDLNQMTEAECKAEFRVEKQDIPTLAEALQIPERFTCPQGTVVDGIEGSCMLLKRFAYPCRYSDMISRFGRPVPESSMITTTVMDYVYDVHGSGVTTMSSDWENPGAPHPNGGPQAQTIAYRATMPFSDYQNSVKSLPKVREMAIQRV